MILYPMASKKRIAKAFILLRVPAALARSLKVEARDRGISRNRLMCERLLQGSPTPAIT